MIVAVRIRGSVGVRKGIRDALAIIRLFRRNHAVLIREDPSHIGMLKKVKDYVTFGKISDEMLLQLLEKRGRVGGKRLGECMKELGYSSLEKLAHDVAAGKTPDKLNPVFRLSPPSSGFKKSIKNHYPKGELGNRKDAINELLKRMI